MILGISSGGMCPQLMLHGHTSAYHSCPGYSAVYASIALLIVCLRSCTTSCGRSAIIGAAAAVVVAGCLVLLLLLLLSLVSLNSLYMSGLERGPYYGMRA